MPKAVDAWHTLNPDIASGKTFDSDINKNIGHPERMRYDRIMLQSAASKWVPSLIEMIGTEPLKKSEGVQIEDSVWASDHFGLYLECTTTL